MSDVAVTCPACAAPLPAGAGYCPACGEAAPTQISGDLPGGRSLPPDDGADQEYRRRLQQALGSQYRLREVIGRGGFGVVYAAWDHELEREVAVKALRHDVVFPTTQLLERFKHEARAVAKLRHPNIIAIYAVGEGDGLAYMIMPRIRGESLRELLTREGPRPSREAAGILRDAADALAEAHSIGIVHRDMKPDNILLEGPERRVLLTDFGIAKTVGSATAGLTGAGMVIGTPQYMSPEQAAGDDSVDHQSDVYSLGVVGYEMITGALPFTGTSLHQIIYAHLASTPSREPLERAGAQPALVNAIMKCLERDRAQRWQSAREVLRAVGVCCRAA